MKTRSLSPLAVCVAASLVVLLAGCPNPSASREESEYFVSFKFDGTPVNFTEGILEYGNVPMAGPETGWQHDGHVYDRTHITAAPVGQPLTELGDATYLVGITLIGEPGSQPPPPGRTPSRTGSTRFISSVTNRRVLAASFTTPAGTPAAPP